MGVRKVRVRGACEDKKGIVQLSIHVLFFYIVTLEFSETMSPGLSFVE